MFLYKCQAILKIISVLHKMNLPSSCIASHHSVSVISQRSKLRPFWSPWQVKKYLATEILTKVANWWPTDYNRKLLGKLIDVWSNYHKEKRRYHWSFSFSPFCCSIRMRKTKMSINWEEAKLYFLYPAEEQNLHPPRQKLTETVLCWDASVTADVITIF